MKRFELIKNIQLMVGGFLTVGLLLACSDDNHSGGNVQEVTEIKIVPPHIDFWPSSRLMVHHEERTLFLDWTEQDTFGILFSNGVHLPLPLKVANYITPEEIKFSGSDWGASGDLTYQAYFPFREKTMAENGKLIFDYTKQWQRKNRESGHLSPYLMMRAKSAHPHNGKLVLELEHMGCFVCMNIRTSKPKMWTSLSFVSDESIFVERGALDVKGETPVFIPLERNDTLTFNLDGVKTTADDLTTTLFIALAKMNLEGNKVKVVLKEKSGLETDYEMPISRLEGGMAYYIGELVPKVYSQYPQPNWYFDENTNPYQSGMTAVVTLPESIKERMVEGDELAAFMENQLRGVGKMVGDKFYLIIHGDIGEKGKVTFKYYNQQQQYMYEAVDCVDFDTDKIYGVADRPAVIPFHVVEN